MPKLVRLYIHHVAIGFALALVFVALLLGFDVAHLRHLIFSSPVGWIAVLMLIVANTVVFAGVQFAIAVMRMAESDDTTGGRRDPVPAMLALAVPVQAEAKEPSRSRARQD